MTPTTAHGPPINIMPRETITSLHNPRVKAAASLRDGRERRRSGLAIVDGLREVRRAFEAGVEVRELYLCAELLAPPDADQLVALGERARAEVVWVAPRVFERLAYGERADGVVAVFTPPKRRFADLVLPPNPLLLVLAGVEKPGNLGAVARTADGAGVDALLVADGVGDVFHPNAIRASLGALFRLPTVAATSAETLAWLRARELRIFAACVEGGVPYSEADFRGPTAIVLGSEAAGLGPEWTAPEIQAVRLPMKGLADSLNVSAAAAVLAYEALRQRTARGALGAGCG
jgi:RNA methyltransferase, TrmH family